MIWVSIDAQTPKRLGEDSRAPTSQRVRTGSQEVRDAGDEAFRERRHFLAWESRGIVAANDNGVQNAIRFPSGGVPAYDIMSPTGGPFRTFDRHVFVLDFRGFPRIRKFTHTEDVDPDLVAPKAPWPPSDFRMPASVESSLNP